MLKSNCSCICSVAVKPGQQMLWKTIHGILLLETGPAPALFSFRGLMQGQPTNDHLQGEA